MTENHHHKIPKLKESSNYQTWKIYMHAYLSAKKCLSAIRVAAADRKSDGCIFGRNSDPIAEAEAKFFENPIRFSPIRQYASLIGLKRIGSDSFLFFVGSEDKNCFRSDSMATLSAIDNVEYIDEDKLNEALFHIKLHLESDPFI